MANKRIRIWIIVLVLLTAAAIAYTFTGASSIAATADKVEYVQNGSYGDPSAAEGINVSFEHLPRGNINTDRVKWKSELSMNGGRADFDVSHEFIPYEGTYSVEGSSQDDIVFYASFDFSPELEVLAREEARSLKEGDGKTITVDLSKYVEYVPVIANYTVGHSSNDSRHYYDPESKTTVIREDVDKVLTELFGIKVRDGLTATMTIYRDKDKFGDISCRYSITEVNYGPSRIWTDISFAGGTYHDGAFYVYNYFGRYENADWLAVSWDRSEPYKLYRIPVKSVEAEKDTTFYELEADKITTFGEIDGSFYIIESRLSEDGPKAMLPGIADGVYRVSIVDFTNGGRLYDMDLSKVTEGRNYDVLIKDDYVVLAINKEGYYVVYPRGNDYDVFFAPTDGKVEDAEVWRHQKWYTKSFDASYSDGKLIVAGFAGETKSVTDAIGTHEYVDAAGVSLAVYSKDGLQYFTRYDSDLFKLQYATTGSSLCSVEIH